jgi:hypothetical protein
VVWQPDGNPIATADPADRQPTGQPPRKRVGLGHGGPGVILLNDEITVAVVAAEIGQNGPKGMRGGTSCVGHQ